MNPLRWLLEGTFVIGGAPILVREVVGNGFGLASAIFGMRRNTWAWPVGMVGNVLLFTVFVSGIFDKPQAHDLWGQSGRQVFFFAVSAYGWWRWRRSRRAGGARDGGAIAPRWARASQLRAMVVAAAAMMVVFYFSLAALGSWNPLADSWILMGSILATYGMARGYVEFWWIWVGVDAVGVPLLFKAQYYPSAVLYLVYGAFCVVGFFAWSAAEKRLEPDPVSQGDLAGAPPSPGEESVHA